MTRLSQHDSLFSLGLDLTNTKVIIKSSYTTHFKHFSHILSQRFECFTHTNTLSYLAYKSVELW